MLVWCSFLFFLGVLAFLDSIFNYGEIFRQGNAFLFMLLSLGLLIRIFVRRKKHKLSSYLEGTTEEQDPKNKKLWVESPS
jgi:cytochrome c oxidase subunit IV